MRGKEKATVQPWCKDWLKCVKDKASPTENAAAVMTAWLPADCKDVCSSTPVVSGGLKIKASLVQKANASLNLLDLHRMTRDDCVTSCSSFQKSLSTCVATIMFDKGK